MKRFLILSLFILNQLTLFGYGETLDLQAVEDLHLGSSKKDGLVDKLGPTQTKAGRLALEKLLSQPLSSVDTIISRQEFLQELVDKPELRAQLKSLFSSYTLHEEKLDHFVARESRSNFYWSWERLNSRAALSLYHFLPVEMVTSIGHFALTSLVLFHQGQIPNVTDLTCGPTCQHNHNHSHSHSHSHNHGHSHSCGSHGCNKHSAHNHNHKPNIHSHPQKMALGWKLVYGAAFYVHIAEHINGVVQSYRHLSHRRNQIRTAYRELRSISQSLQAAKDIFFQVNQNANVLGKQPKQLLELFNMLPPADVLQSEEIPTYLGIFQRRIGDYLVAYRQLAQSKHSFSTVAEYVGKVDAYLTIADLFASQRDKKNSFTWVDLRSSSSVFEAKGIWNPMLEPEFAVANDLSFDAENNKLLLTGANASGKSVFASTIALNASLAQSFGVAAAKSLTLTPFKKILTHINFTDDVNQGLSTMRAELKLVGCILKQASGNLDSMLVIFDDSLFKGTSTSVGETLAFKTFRRLANVAPEVTVIGVTHYDGLVKAVQLDDVLSGSFRLAHMAIRMDEVGLWEPTFKLEFGTPNYDSPLVLLPKEELIDTFGRD